MVPTSHDGGSSGRSSRGKAANYGVLLRLRVLHRSNKYPTNKGKGRGPAFFLGTVSKYRNEVKLLPPAKGKSSTMDIGCYKVRFDHGGLMQMHPDQVIAGVNLFHEQQQLQLGFRSRPPGDEIYPVISQISKMLQDDAKVGRQLLLAQNNWPLCGSDLIDLDKERKEYVQLGCEGPHPIRVDPTWFQDVIPTSTSTKPFQVRVRSKPSAQHTAQPTVQPPAVVVIVANASVERSKQQSSIDYQSELSSSANNLAASIAQKQQEKLAESQQQETTIEKGPVPTTKEVIPPTVRQEVSAAKKRSPLKESCSIKKLDQQPPTQLSIPPTRLISQKPGKAMNEETRPTKEQEQQPPAKIVNPPKSLKELKQQNRGSRTTREVAAKIANNSKPPQDSSTAAKKGSSPIEQHAVQSVAKKHSLLAAQTLQTANEQANHVEDAKQSSSVPINSSLSEGQKKKTPPQRRSLSQEEKKPQSASDGISTNKMPAQTTASEKSAAALNLTEELQLKKLTILPVVQGGSKSQTLISTKSSVLKKLSKTSAVKQGGSKVEIKQIVRRRPLPKAGHKKSSSGQQELDESESTKGEPESEDSIPKRPSQVDGKKISKSILDVHIVAMSKGNVTTAEATANKSAVNENLNICASESQVAAPANSNKSYFESNVIESAKKQSTNKRKSTKPVDLQNTAEKKRKVEKRKNISSEPEGAVHVSSPTSGQKEELKAVAAATAELRAGPTDKLSEPLHCERSPSLTSAVAKASKAAAAAVRTTEKKYASEIEAKKSDASEEVSVSKEQPKPTIELEFFTAVASFPKKGEQETATAEGSSSVEGVCKSVGQIKSPAYLDSKNACSKNFSTKEEVVRPDPISAAAKKTSKSRDRMLEVGVPVEDEGGEINGRDREHEAKSKRDESGSSAVQPNAQKGGPLGFLAELASAREATLNKTNASSELPQRDVAGRGSTSVRKTFKNGAGSKPAKKNGTASKSGTLMTGKKTTQDEASSPVPHTKGRPSPSRRGLSDGSGDSIHRAGTPKSHNMAADDRSGRGRSNTGAPKLPDLKEALSSTGGISSNRLAMPHLSQKLDGGAVVAKQPTEKEILSSGQKRSAEESKMVPPKAIKRQRSFPTRPPLIINRQRSTGSRLSFADEVQFVEPISHGPLTTDRRIAAPPVLRNSDRQHSLESLQPPSVIRGGDRQSSVESYASLRSQEMALTPNSRLTPSMLAHSSVLSPSADTPNTERMEDLYDQLDQYMESPSQKSQESPGLRALPFRPRPMNAKRQTSAVSFASMNSHSELKLPAASHFESEKEKGALPNLGREVSSDRPRNVSVTQNGGRAVGGLAPLTIPTDGEIDQLSKFSTPTAQIRKSPRGGRRGAALRQFSQNKPIPERARTIGQMPMHSQQQKVHRMVSEGVAGPAPMQAEGLKAWLEGSGGGGSGMEQDLRAPQLNPIRQVSQGPGMRGLPNQGFQFQSQYNMAPSGMVPAGHIPRARMAQNVPHPYERRHVSCDSATQFKQGMQPYDAYSKSFMRQEPCEQQTQRQPDQVNQFHRKKVVELGHPREEVVEGQQIYSRHTLLLWGAHKSDVCPVNGSPKDGCDSILYLNAADETPKSKDDLQFIQYKCSIRNGGGALFSNYQRSQHRNAPHSYPIRIFRKSKAANGASGLRYDGLYHVAAIHDDRGRPRSEPTKSSKTFSFLLKRNRAGPAGDQNHFMVEELWGLVQRDGSPPHPSQERRSGGGGSQPMNHLRLPHLSHGGGRGFQGVGDHHHGNLMMGGLEEPAAHFMMGGLGQPAAHPMMGGMGQPAARPMMGEMGQLKAHPLRPRLDRKSSAEVSLIHIRYYDDSQQQQQMHQQYNPHALNHRSQAMSPQRAHPMMEQHPVMMQQQAMAQQTGMMHTMPGMHPWPNPTMSGLK